MYDEYLADAYRACNDSGEPVTPETLAEMAADGVMFHEQIPEEQADLLVHQLTEEARYLLGIG